MPECVIFVSYRITTTLTYQTGRFEGRQLCKTPKLGEPSLPISRLGLPAWVGLEVEWSHFSSKYLYDNSF